MRKSTRKKLALPRETIRTLTDAHLVTVAGGVMNTYKAGGGQWCSTVYMTHCNGCTQTQGNEVTDCQP